jgi:predicted O-linked N-acetylglucosamine transferase (SPINDLY family)
LDRSKFQPVLVCSQGIVETCRRALRRTDVECVPLPDRFRPAVESLAAARCDVLYHWQIGTDPLNYLLPFARTAAVQYSGWGMHATSGVSAVDYYVSSKLVEKEDAQEHYTESLYCFDTLPVYHSRIPSPQPATRSQFGLPEAGHLYFAPQRPAKFHPDQDPLLRGILQADSKGYVVLVERNRQAVAALRARFERTLGDVAGRVLFVPQVKDFHQFLALADVFLDTMHYSIGLMGHDAFALNLPVVTLPGEFNVERFALGFYRKMGLTDLVAGNAEEYIAVAVRLGTDRQWREWIRSRIAERSEVLFDDFEAVREHERFFEYALARAEREAG